MVPRSIQFGPAEAVLAVRIGKTRLIDNHDVSKVFPG